MKNIRIILTHIFSFLRKKESKTVKPFVYVAIGDSTIEGIGASTREKSFASLIFAFLRTQFKQVEFYNFGKRDSRVKDVIDQQLSHAIAKTPDLIILSVGANDIKHRTSTKTFEKYFSELLTTLKNETQAKIVINTIPDLSLLSIIPRPIRFYCKWIVIRFNQKITKHSKVTGAVLIDTYRQSKIVKGLKELVSEDGIHPSDDGHALWAQNIIKQIYQILFTPQNNLT